MKILMKEGVEVVQTYCGTVRVFSFWQEMFNDALYFKEMAENLSEDSSEFERWRYLRASIIFSFAALESYINAFIDRSLIENEKLIESIEEKQFLKNVIEFLKKQLQNRPIAEKLKTGVELITNEEFDTKSSEYSDFIDLKKLRNRLIHAKDEKENLSIHRKYITLLVAEKSLETVRGIIKMIHKLEGTSYPEFVDRVKSGRNGK